jgi:ABC-type multidrug transport system fused ATPase/permease subunit
MTDVPSTPDAPSRTLLWQLLRREQKLLTIAVILSILAALLELAPYWLVFMIVDELSIAAPRQGSMLACAAGILLSAVARFVIFGAANIASHKAAFRLQGHLRRRSMRSLHTSWLERIDGGGGKLKKVVIDDVSGLEHFIAHNLPEAVSGFAMPVLAAVLLLIVDWQMTIVSLALAPVAFLAQRRAFRGLDTIYSQWHRAEERANTTILGYIRGIATLKAYHRVASSLDDMRRTMHELADLAEAVTRRTAIPYALFFALLSTNLVLVLPAGILLLAHGSLTLSAFVLFATLGAGLTAPILRALLALAAWQRQRHGLARLADILSWPARPASSALPSGYDISLENVSFRYEGEAQALANVTLQIPAGKTTALVGPSGAGKSTMLRLMAGFSNRYSGSIRIGDVELREMEPAPPVMATIFQQPFLFHGTIRDNLLLAAPDAPEADLRRVLAAVGLDHLVARTSAGLDAEVGESGARLSGGERQRLALARVLLKRAPILLLDEPTAFVDPETERWIHQALSNFSTGRTQVIVAHRLATVLDADQIVVLDQGRVEATGRHPDLLAISPTYRRLWDRQIQAMRWSITKSGIAGVQVVS